MQVEELLETKSTPCIVVDVQPAYSGINDGDENYVFEEIIRFVNSQTGPILMLVNDDSEGLTNDSIPSIKLYWEESGFDPANWSRVKIVNKGYGFFRSWMDTGIRESTIVKTIRLMYQMKINDSRELIVPEIGYDDVVNALDQMDSDPLITDWISVALLKRFNHSYIMGGGRNECLREVELLMNAFNVRYKRVDELVYG